MNLWAEPGQLGALALLSGWTALDTTEALQIMVCQPLPAGCLAGWLTGQPELGLFVGGALQLLWSRLAPVGAAAFPDVGPGTVAGVAAGASLLPVGAPWAAVDGAAGFLPGPGHVGAVLVAAFVALLTARINQDIVVAHRRANAGLARRADAAGAVGSFAGVEAANALGLVGGFFRGVITVPVALAATTLALAIYRGVLPGGLERAAGGGIPAGIPNIGPALLWGLGLAALAATLLRARRADWLLLAGGVAVGVLLALVRP